jgi:hypothetical protein
MAVVFLGLGAMSLVAPTNLTPLVEIFMPTRIAVMEVRGVYGGLFFGIGFFFLLFARRDSWLRPGLIAQCGIMGGFVLGRTVGILLGGAPNLLIAALLAGEVFMRQWRYLRCGYSNDSAALYCKLESFVSLDARRDSRQANNAP